MGCFSCSPPDAPEAPSASDIQDIALPLFMLQIAGQGGSSYGPGGSMVRGRTVDGEFVPFDAAAYRSAIESGDMGSALEMISAANETRWEETPEQAALRDAGRQTQTMQNQMGQMLLGQILGGEVPMSGPQSYYRPPQGLTPWQNTEANPFPTYQPETPEYQIPLGAISLGSPFGAYQNPGPRRDLVQAWQEGGG